MDKSKVRVYSDSVLCVEQMNESKEAIKRWEGQVEEFNLYPSYQVLSGIDREAIEYDWNIFQGCENRTSNLKNSNRIIFMSMVNDIDWTKRGDDEICFSNAEKVKDYAMKFLQRQWCGKSSYSLPQPQNGTAIPRNRSSRVQKHQCFES